MAGLYFAWNSALRELTKPDAGVVSFHVNILLFILKGFDNQPQINIFTLLQLKGGYMVCLHTQYLHLEYHERDNILLSQWYGTCSSLQYRQALILLLRLAREHKVNYAITDRRLLPPLSESDFTWTIEVYQKAFNSLPIKRFAIIKPFNEEAVKQQSELVKHRNDTSHIETRAFDDLTSAYKWIVTPTA